MLLITSLMTNDHLNVLMEDGRPNVDVWGIGDAAQITGAPLPATAQGKYLLSDMLCRCMLTGF